MPNTRIKGEDTELSVTLNGKTQTQFAEVRSNEITYLLELKKEGYLGETTERKDEIFNGTKGRMELHFSTKTVFDFFKAIVDRAQRRAPGTVVNIKTTLNFPNGDRPRVMIRDLAFGEIPVNFASRTDYGAVTLDWESSEAPQVV